MADSGDDARRSADKHGQNDEFNLRPELRLWKSRMGVGRMAYEGGYYAQAVRQFRLALEILKEAKVDGGALARNLVCLAKALLHIDQAEESERLLRQAMTIDEGNPEAANFEFILDLTTIAKLYRETGRLELAEQAANRALALIGKLDSPLDELKAIALKELAIDCGKEGKYAECEQLLDKDLQFVESSNQLGQHHFLYNELLLLKAFLAAEEGRLDESQSLYQEAMPQIELAKGPYHPWVADIMEVSAHYAEMAGNADEAKALKDKAQHIRQHNRHPEAY